MLKKKKTNKPLHLQQVSIYPDTKMAEKKWDFSSPMYVRIYNTMT